MLFLQDLKYQRPKVAEKLSIQTQELRPKHDRRYRIARLHKPPTPYSWKTHKFLWAIRLKLVEADVREKSSFYLPLDVDIDRPPNIS